jgi:hypothetical protein
MENKCGFGKHICFYRKIHKTKTFDILNAYGRYNNHYLVFKYISILEKSEI